MRTRSLPQAPARFMGHPAPARATDRSDRIAARSTGRTAAGSAVLRRVLLRCYPEDLLGDRLGPRCAGERGPQVPGFVAVAHHARVVALVGIASGVWIGEAEPLAQQLHVA